MQGFSGYGNGTRFTTTNVGPSPTQISTPTPSNYEGLYDLARQLFRRPAAPAAARSSIGGVSLGGGSARPTMMGGSASTPASDRNSGPSFALQAMRNEAEAQRIQQSMAPPPMRATTFASGANNAYVQDVNAMTPFQRQMFLPGNAQGGTIAGLIGAPPTERVYGNFVGPAGYAEPGGRLRPVE